MRCLKCGMPLSPKRSQCPRCGTDIPGRIDAPSSSAKREGRQQAFPASQQEQSPWAGAGWGGAANNAPTQEQAFFPQELNYEQGTPWGLGEQNFNQQPGEMNSSPRYNSPKGSNLFTPRVGFTIASTCIATGTLILVLVFALSRTLPPTSTAQTSQAAHTAIAPTPTMEPTIPPTPTPTPAPGGLQYFSGAQMGDEINNNTAQIITQTTTFKLHEKIYVTFQVHTGNQIGAACLLWHWGDKSQTPFQFQLQGSTGSAYSYMPAESTGTGKVEIYYASTTACSDKILAQAVDFSVNQ